MKMKGTTGKPKMVNGKVQKPKKTKKLEKAEEAVARYEEMRDDYIAAQQEFEKAYPKAFAKMQEIRAREDDVREQIGACKILVRDAGQSIGEFTFTSKFSSEGFVGARILELIAKMPAKEAGELIKELFDRGFLADVKIDKAAAKVIRASDPELREKLSPAWDKGGDPLTPAIGTPKI
jgi:hypothetical protein